MNVPSFLKDEAAQMQEMLYRLSQLHPVDQVCFILFFVAAGVVMALVFDKILIITKKRFEHAAATGEYIRRETEKRAAEARRKANEGDDK